MGEDILHGFGKLVSKVGMFFKQRKLGNKFDSDIKQQIDSFISAIDSGYSGGIVSYGTKLKKGVLVPSVIYTIVVSQKTGRYVSKNLHQSLVWQVGYNSYYCFPVMQVGSNLYQIEISSN